MQHASVLSNPDRREVKDLRPGREPIGERGEKGRQRNSGHDFPGGRSRAHLESVDVQTTVCTARITLRSIVRRQGNRNWRRLGSGRKKKWCPGARRAFSFSSVASHKVRQNHLPQKSGVFRNQCLTCNGTDIPSPSLGLCVASTLFPNLGRRAS